MIRPTMIAHPVTSSAFPEFLPVAEDNFLAYSCAAARDFAPASLSSPSGKDARSERYDKDQT
jgi:hypothetical protein